MDFPQYRKRFDNKSYYKIINERAFEEVQLIGDKIFLHQIQADKYFEIIRVKDMLELQGEIFLICSAQEYEEIRTRNL